MGVDRGDGFLVRECDPVAAGEFGRACGVGPVAGQLLLQRGIDDAAQARAFLSPRLRELSAPDGMCDRAEAAERIVAAIRKRERIVVFGDYDVDGTASAAILTDTLEALGADVQVFVADRFRGGYGFSEQALGRTRELGAQLIVTCDCGSSDHERIASAQRAGVDVIVVDHHRVPEEPLGACAFMNPHRPECAFPYKGLASVGLVFSLMAEVRARLGRDLDLRDWLDLVAIGTIADVAPLDGDNRLLVRAGLERIARGLGRPATRALREIFGQKGCGSVVPASAVAFRFAPRLNAAGRLGRSDLTLALLRARSLEQARALAGEVEALNQERRALTEQAEQEALAQVVEHYGAEPECGVVVYSARWHRGVVGIVAARLVDRFGVPALVLAVDEEQAHGSGRTPEGFGLYDAVARCSAMLLRFGGHRAAVGLTVASERLCALREAFGAETARGEAAARARTVDLVLDGHRFPLPAASDLLALEPLGQGNAEPLFAVVDARIEQRRTVGDGHLKLDLSMGARRLSAFGPRLGQAAGLQPGATPVLFGHLRPDFYRGGESVELVIAEG